MIQRSMVHADAAAAAVARTIDRGRGAKTYALVRRTRLFRPVGPHLPPYKQAGWYDASRRSHSRSEASTPDRPVLVISRAVLACLALRCVAHPPTPYPSVPPDVGVMSGLVGLASLPLLPGRCDATATATAACVHVTLPCRAAACARSLRSPVAVAPLWPLQYCRDPSTHVRHRHSVPRVTGLFSGLSPSAWVLGRAASNKGCQSLGVPAKVASTCVLKKIYMTNDSSQDVIICSFGCDHM
jgi:hypothetical protein